MQFNDVTIFVGKKARVDHPYWRCGASSPFNNKDYLHSEHKLVITRITKYGVKVIIFSKTSTVPTLKFGNG